MSWWNDFYRSNNTTFCTVYKQTIFSSVASRRKPELMCDILRPVLEFRSSWTCAIFSTHVQIKVGKVGGGCEIYDPLKCVTLQPFCDVIIQVTVLLHYPLTQREQSVKVGLMWYLFRGEYINKTTLRFEVYYDCFIVLNWLSSRSCLLWQGGWWWCWRTDLRLGSETQKCTKRALNIFFGTVPSR